VLVLSRAAFVLSRATRSDHCRYGHRPDWRAPADGYTLLLAGTPNAVNVTLYDKLNFNFIRDIAPVAGIISLPFVMVVNPTVPAKTVPEFIGYAKANAGKINYASVGIGSAGHVSSELFKM
jgi:tripartite-type tricarboxylate transporter receptor subunit TctC